MSNSFSFSSFYRTFWHIFCKPKPFSPGLRSSFRLVCLLQRVFSRFSERVDRLLIKLDSWDRHEGRNNAARCCLLLPLTGGHHEQHRQRYLLCRRRQQRFLHWHPGQLLESPAPPLHRGGGDRSPARVECPH